MTCRTLKNEPILLEVKTKNDKTNEVKSKTEEHDHENILKSPKIKMIVIRRSKKVYIKRKTLIISEILKGSGSAETTSTLSILHSSIGVVLTNSRALLTSLAILITNEYISKFKIRYTKLRNWSISGGKNVGLTDMYGQGIIIKDMWTNSNKVS